MKKALCRILLVMMVVSGLQREALGEVEKSFHGGRHKRSGDTLIIDPANPVTTHLLYLETDSGTDVVERSYLRNLARLNSAIAAQPGFLSYMTLHNLERNKLVVYYQFESRSEWHDAMEDSDVVDEADELRGSSNRYDIYESEIAEPNNVEQAPGAPSGDFDPVLRVKKGDGFGINEAVVVDGRSQSELTELMLGAGQFINPGDSAGFNGNMLHLAVDESRNFNLLHWSNTRTMTVGALNYLVQELVNTGRTGIDEGWGPAGVGLIAVSIYTILDIHVSDR